MEDRNAGGVVVAITVFLKNVIAKNVLLVNLQTNTVTFLLAKTVVLVNLMSYEVNQIAKIVVYQSLSAFDCTEVKNSVALEVSFKKLTTLDIDPEITCYNDSNHNIIILASLLSIIFYTLTPMIYTWICGRREKKMPEWVDPHHENRDYRQRYGWFYSKYHEKCFNYEYVVLLQKVLVGGISLFFTTRQNISLPLLIFLNILFIGITAYYQPYLTDEDFKIIKQFGRKQSAVYLHHKPCSKKGFGVNNCLDIILLTAEICMYISALIIYNLDITPSSPLTLNATSPLTLNATSLSTINVLEEESVVDLTTAQDTLAERIAQNYPVENGIIGMFEYIGLFLFMIGFLYFLFTDYLCCKMCCESTSENDDNEIQQRQKSRVEIVPVMSVEQAKRTESSSTPVKKNQKRGASTPPKHDNDSKDIEEFRGSNIVPSVSMQILKAAKNEDVEMLKKKLNANEVDISFVDRENARNALHYAAEHNKRDLKTINMLLGHSSFSEKVLNQQDEFGYTPLDYAFYNFSSCKKDIIELLQSKGAKRRKELKP